MCKNKIHIRDLKQEEGIHKLLFLYYTFGKPRELGMHEEEYSVVPPFKDEEEQHIFELYSICDGGRNDRERKQWRLHLH